MATETTTMLRQVEGKVLQSYADMNALYSEGLEAMVASNNTLVKGYQSMTNELLAFSQGQIKQGFDVSERMVAAGSLNLAAEIQADYLGGWARAYADECKKLGGMIETVVKELLMEAERGSKAVAAQVTAAAAA